MDSIMGDEITIVRESFGLWIPRHNDRRVSFQTGWGQFLSTKELDMRRKVGFAVLVLLVPFVAAAAGSLPFVAIGDGAKALRGDGVAVGRRAVAKGFPEVADEQGLETIAIGAD